MVVDWKGYFSSKNDSKKKYCYYLPHPENVVNNSPVSLLFVQLSFGPQGAKGGQKGGS